MAVKAWQGQAPQGPNVLTTTKVKDNLYMLSNPASGGNTAAWITAGGVVLVDTKNPGWGQAILDQLKTVTDKPVAMIINTHTHGDHVSNNDFFGTTVEIVAQENTKTNMAKLPVFAGEKSRFLPSKTFKDKTTLLKGNEEIDLYYFGPGHTNGDAWVVFKSVHTVHAGDMFASKAPPFVDATNGGSAVQFPETLKKAAAGLKGVDTIITGHSATTMTMADLNEFQQFNQEFVDAVRAQLKAGKTVDEIAAGWTVPAKYAGYTLGSRVKGDIQVIADEIKK
jgi:glyoxylase-like metal-dependent hydrolase (beta-lactamase superfamily II)